jgi:Uma2 family endonuclease
MSNADVSSSTKTLVRFQLPEPPQRHPDEVTSYKYVHMLGHSMHLAKHLGKPETTIVGAELYIVAHRGYRPRRVPDLLIAFDVDPELYDEQNGYVISDQDKPPDFILEVASPSTAHIDTVDKRREYAELGVTEYWRFDHTGESHGTRLAGDRLVGERYEPIPVVELSPEVWQGESEVLGLWLRWEHGTLGWYDPATGQHIPTFDAEREGRLAERERRLTEREGRLAAEARVRELEEELRRLRQP